VSVAAPRRRLVVGNWKMNGSRPANAALLAALRDNGPIDAELAVCPPAVFVADVAAQLAGSAVAWGAQDCSAEASGAFTGEVSAAMLRELGCRYAIVGHSERRARHGEADALVARKAKAALAQGVTPIVCVGETLAERDAGSTDEVVKRQLAAVIHELAHCAGEIVIAYEPVWAIGTGRSATPAMAGAVHAVLRAQMHAATGHGERVRILYGGSVKPDNASALFAEPHIDGALVGGASLAAADFLGIARA
jgi:triosephosphate isomerase